MSSRIGNSYRVATNKAGKTVLVQVKKRRDLCTELKAKKSNKIRVCRGAKCAS